MGYKEEYEATRKTAYDTYMKTIKKIEGDTNNIDTITLNWNANKNQWDGDNETTDYEENIPKEPTKADGNLGKQKLYIVAKKGATNESRDAILGVTHNKPNWTNSRSGFWMEIDSTNYNNNTKEWKRLINQYLGDKYDDDDNSRGGWGGSGWTSKIHAGKITSGKRVDELVSSGKKFKKIGTRSGYYTVPGIKNLDTGETLYLWSGAGHHSGTVHDINSSSSHYRNGSRNSWAGKNEMHNITVDIDDKYNTKQNAEGDRIRDANIETNRKNTAKNNLYDKVKGALTTTTHGGDYVKQRDKITKDDLIAAGISNSNANKIVNQLKGVYKDFYRDEHLHTWDNSLGAKPEYGSFSADYYSNNNAVAREKYDEAVANDDIDLTEGYGRTNYMWWHYTTVGKDSGARGNEAEVLNMASEYLEEAPDIQEGGWENQTDADVMAVRDKQLGIVDEDLDMIEDVPEIKAAWEEAKNAKKEGDTDNYWVKLAGQNYLKVTEPEQFAYLYKISARGNEAQGIAPNEEHKKVMDSLIGTGAGITDLEDRITESVGTQNLLNVERFGALNQNILKESIDEMKRAKVKEQEMAMFRNFGQFNEVLNINETLSNSILGDSGIGGYLAITGDDDFDQDKLERKLSGITGVNNNAVHNWQKWFDEKIQQKYDDDIELGYTVDDAERNITIQKEFAEDYVNSYLKPRFDESRSMSEFVEYLDVRQEEQNPFQTQDILNAVQQVGQSHAESYLDQLRSASDKGFDSTFYTDPTGKAGMNEAREADYTKQRDMVAADWDKAQNNPDELVDPLNPGLGTWREQIYRFGTDVTSADQFARLHYQIKGQHENYKFDGAEDIMSPGKVKEMIYTQIFPALQDEVARQPHVFGQFIRPEEFADDMLEGIDPNVPDSWESALTGSDGKSLIEGFTGSFDELKQYVIDGMSGNSALDMRQSIKYLNEKKERPTQELLGIDYIQRDEDYNPADQLKGDTQLYKIFQGAGYEGTEDDFYDKVFPDLDPSSQELLTQAGSKDGKITLGSWDDSDPYAALGSVETLLGDDFGSPTKKTTTDKKDKKSSVFSFDPFDDDDDDDDYKSAKGQEILSDFTKGFKFF